MKFIINGSNKLSGEIEVRGSKNATTPIIAATILSDKRVVLKNIPLIKDCLTMLDILKSMGSEIVWISKNSVSINNKNLDPKKLNQELVCKIRSSLLIVGPMLARFGEVTIATPGGCVIGARPIDTHLEAFKSLGAEVFFDEKMGAHNIKLGKVSKNLVILREASVTGTESVMMLGYKYAFEIRNAAMEPHVVALGNFLKKLGVKISGLGTYGMKIIPAKSKPKEINFSIINDEIEMGTFAILGAATRSKITISGVIPEHLDLTLEKLREMGVVFEIVGDKMIIDGPKCDLKSAKIEARPYPGLPSDLQAMFSVLATQAKGSSLIFDTLYEGRLKYLEELKKMGAEATILDPHRAIVTGPTILYGTEVTSLDLRAGATLVIAALIAKGKSVLGNAEQIDRGYENIDERLKKIGADITREE